MRRIWGWLYPENCFFLPNELSDKQHACIRESWETFHWSLTNLELLLCDLCVIYTWIFENQVSKKINSFYYLAIWNNKPSFKDRLKAFIWLRAVSYLLEAFQRRSKFKMPKILEHLFSNLTPWTFQLVSFQSRNFKIERTAAKMCLVKAYITT